MKLIIKSSNHIEDYESHDWENNEMGYALVLTMIKTLKLHEIILERLMRTVHND